MRGWAPVVSARSRLQTSEVLSRSQKSDLLRVPYLRSRTPLHMLYLCKYDFAMQAQGLILLFSILLGPASLQDVAAPSPAPLPGGWLGSVLGPFSEHSLKGIYRDSQVFLYILISPHQSYLTHSTLSSLASWEQLCIITKPQEVGILFKLLTALHALQCVEMRLTM